MKKGDKVLVKYLNSWRKATVIKVHKNKNKYSNGTKCMDRVQVMLDEWTIDSLTFDHYLVKPNKGENNGTYNYIS